MLSTKLPTSRGYIAVMSVPNATCHRDAIQVISVHQSVMVSSDKTICHSIRPIVHLFSGISVGYELTKWTSPLEINPLIMPGNSLLKSKPPWSHPSAHRTIVPNS